MATYKVIQDIEADDKLVGPLTFRQFVYALIAGLNFWLAFLVMSKGALPLVAVFFPIGAIAGFFAWPFTSNQPTEVWALAKVRFLIIPRKRVWDQSGVKELVTITVPKKVEKRLTNGLSQYEVRNRLRALADTIDTRGWAIKNVNVSMMGQPALISNNDSDRLVAASVAPPPVIVDELDASEDMLDEQNSPVAKQFDTMIAASARAHRQDILKKMEKATTPLTPPPAPAPLQPVPKNDYWFLNQPTQQVASVPQNTVTFNTQVVAPGTPTSVLPVAAAVPTKDEESFIKEHKAMPAFSPNMHGHLHVIQPLSAQQSQQTAATTEANESIDGTTTITPPVPEKQSAVARDSQQQTTSSQVTQTRDTAILDLARNDDLNVATIAREAQKRQEPPEDEVVISLH